MSTITITVELKDSEMAGTLAELTQTLERRGANGAVSWKSGAAATGSAMSAANAPQAVSPAEYAKGGTAAAAAAGSAMSAANAPQAVSPAEYAKGGTAAGAATGTGSAPWMVSPAGYAKGGTTAGAATGSATNAPLVWSLPGTESAAAAKGVTFDDIARAAWTLVEAGRGLHFKELLEKFGIGALTQLPAERFGAFAQALRQLGVQI